MAPRKNTPLEPVDGIDLEADCPQCERPRLRARYDDETETVVTWCNNCGYLDRDDIAPTCQLCGTGGPGSVHDPAQHDQAHARRHKESAALVEELTAIGLTGENLNTAVKDATGIDMAGFGVNDLQAQVVFLFGQFGGLAKIRQELGLGAGTA